MVSSGTPNDERTTIAEEAGAPQTLTPEREAEIREWRDELGARKDFTAVGPYCALHDSLAEIERLRAELATTERRVRAQIAADFEAYGKTHDTLSWGQAFYIARDGLNGGAA